ncbi:MAG: hypothetical protein ACKVQK_15110 [Burkholderiales bacterium]
MSTELRRETLAIVRHLEAVSDRPVDLREQADLPVMATIRAARDGAPMHVLKYRPGGDLLDYQVATQCAHVLRLYQRPPDQRFLFSSSGQRVATVEQMLRSSMKDQADAVAIQRFAKLVFDWLLLSVRSIPVGMRIDAWLWHDHPGLRPQVEEGLNRQMREHLQAATRDFDGLRMPAAFVSLPAAYALFADRLLGNNLFGIAWRSMGVTDDAAALLAIFDRVPETPLADDRLIDEFAAHLGVAGWYDWLAFKE